MGPIIELIATATAREKALNNPVEVFTSDLPVRQAERDEVRDLHAPPARGPLRRARWSSTSTRRRSCRCGSRPTTTPKPGATTGELLEAYSFTDLKFNTGIGENAFDY